MGCDWEYCEECGNVYNIWNMDKCDNYGCKVERCCPWCKYCSKKCEDEDKLKDKIIDLLDFKSTSKNWKMREKMINKSKEELLRAIEKINLTNSVQK